MAHKNRGKYNIILYFLIFETNRKIYGRDHRGARSLVSTLDCSVLSRSNVVIIGFITQYKND